MCPALPDSDYYGGSAPPRTDRSTVDPPPRRHWLCRPVGRTGMVPVFTVIRSMKEEPDFAPAASPRLPRSTSSWPSPAHPEPVRSSLVMPTGQDEVRAAPDPYPPDLSRFGFEGRFTPVPLVLLSITLAGPAPSGSTGTPRRCQDCSRPPQHLLDQAVLSFTVLLRQDQWRCRGRTGAPCLPFGRWVSPARPPHRTCDSHRIRRSTDSLGTARLRPSRFSPMVSGCCSPASDSG